MGQRQGHRRGQAGEVRCGLGGLPWRSVRLVPFRPQSSPQGQASAMGLKPHSACGGGWLRRGRCFRRALRILVVAAPSISRAWACLVWLCVLRAFGLRRWKRFRRHADRGTRLEATCGVGGLGATRSVGRSDGDDGAIAVAVSCDADWLKDAGLCANFDRYARERHEQEFECIRLGLGLAAVMIVLFWALALLAEVDMPRPRTSTTEYAEPAPQQSRATSSMAVSVASDFASSEWGWSDAR